MRRPHRGAYFTQVNTLSARLGGGGSLAGEPACRTSASRCAIGSRRISSGGIAEWEANQCARDDDEIDDTMVAFEDAVAISWAD